MNFKVCLKNEIGAVAPMQQTHSEMECVHTKILCCDTTKEKLHQRRGTGWGISITMSSILTCFVTGFSSTINFMQLI